MSSKLIKKVLRDISEARLRAYKELQNLGLNRQDGFICLFAISAAENMARRKFDFEWISPRGLRRCDIDVNLGFNLFADSLNQYRQGSRDFSDRLNKALKHIAYSLTK